MRNKLQRLYLVSLEKVFTLLFFRLLLPAGQRLVDGNENLSGKVNHDGLCRVKWTEDWVILLVVCQFVETKGHFLENGLPPEDVVIEVINCSWKLTLQNVLFKGVGLGERQVVDIDLEDRNEDVTSTIDQIERKSIYLQLQIFQATTFILAHILLRLWLFTCFIVKISDIFALFSDMLQDTLQKEDVLWGKFEMGAIDVHGAFCNSANGGSIEVSHS